VPGQAVRAQKFALLQAIRMPHTDGADGAGQAVRAQKFAPLQAIRMPHRVGADGMVGDHRRQTACGHHVAPAQKVGDLTRAGV
jgi:hypothetical protein